MPNQAKTAGQAVALYEDLHGQWIYRKQQKVRVRQADGRQDWISIQKRVYA
jgi:hypothetical protein